MKIVNPNGSSPLRVLMTLMLGSVLATGAMAGDPKLLSAYVVLFQGNDGTAQALARVILDQVDAACPTLEDGSRKSDKVTMTPRPNPDPENFPIQVCEALYPTGKALKVKQDKVHLPVVPETVSNLIVIGDTGCKPKDQKDCHQDDPKHWPFPAMSALAAKDKPDLVLHMGDYNYRGTPGKIHVNGKKTPVYDAGDNAVGATCQLKGPYVGQNSIGSDTPDTWEAWWKDFFKPASDLLLAAPWIVARGNHELCSRAGPGWFFLLEPGSRLLGPSADQLTCPPAASSDPLVFRPAYRVDFSNLSVVMIDSSNACDEGSLHQEFYDDQLIRVGSLVSDAPNENAIWLQSHRPIWALKKAGEDTPKEDLDPSGRYLSIDKTLQKAYAKTPLPRSIHLSLAGHMHRFQAITFPNTGNKMRPVQLVVGNGGVDLASNHPKEAFSVQIDGMTGIGFGLSKFGYMDVLLNNKGHWQGKLRDRHGKKIAVCDSKKQWKTGVCKPDD